MCASELGTLGFATIREPLMTSQVTLGNGHGVWGVRPSMISVSGATNFSTTPRRTIGSSRLMSGTALSPLDTHVSVSDSKEPGLRLPRGDHLAGLRLWWCSGRERFPAPMARLELEGAAHRVGHGAQVGQRGGIR